MLEIARHVRIFDTDPSDDLVTKRSSAVETLAEKFGKLKSVDELLLLAQDISVALSAKNHAISETRTIEVEDAIKVLSPAFDRENQQMQILTCAMLGVLKLIKDSSPGNVLWTRVEVIAVGLWLSLSIQRPRSEPRLEALRAELMAASKELIVKSSESSRLRTSVPDSGVKVTDIADPVKVGEAVNKGLAKTVDALRTNAALDREELDLLWWSLGDWSELQQKSYQQLNSSAVAITAGIEAAGLMRRLPAEAHKHLVLRRVQSGTSAMKLPELAVSLGEEIGPLRDRYLENHMVTAFPEIFRLLSSLAGNKRSSESRDLREWGARALLEAVVVHLAASTAVL